MTGGEFLHALRGILYDLGRVRAPSAGWRSQHGDLSATCSEGRVLLSVRVSDGAPGWRVAAVWPAGADPDRGGLLWCVLRAREEWAVSLEIRRRDGTLTAAEHEVEEVMGS